MNPAALLPFDTLKSSAVLSEDEVYRYVLERIWGAGPIAVFIMLNPSTADALKNDPTIRRCIGFAQAWGCGGLFGLNAFAYRATLPADMLKAEDPVGPDNLAHIGRKIDEARANGTGRVLCAWGAHGGHLGQAEIVIDLLKSKSVEPVCFGKTKAGHPKHPLYLPYDTELVPLAA